MNKHPIKLRFLLFSMIGSLLWVNSAQADNVGINGPGWQIKGGRIQISADSVENYTPGGESGKLRLRVWAYTNSVYSSYPEGYVLGEYSLPKLPGGFGYNNIQVSVPYKAPPAGYYYTTITVEEYIETSWVFDDTAEDIFYYSTIPFGKGIRGGIAGNGVEVDGTLEFYGDGSYSLSQKSLTLKVYEIYNGGYQTTGTLRLRLWASANPYSGGSLTGYVLGTRELGQLSADCWYQNTDDTVPYAKPPIGTYYLTMTLEEYENGNYDIIDYYNFPARTL